MERLLTREELIASGFPYGRVADDIPLGNDQTEWMRTKPDVKVYIPKSDCSDDCDNCVLGVVPTPDGRELIMIWTQSSVEGNGDNRLVISRSADGEHWSTPQVILGAKRKGEMQSSWGMPMYTNSGRLYVCYLQETENYELSPAISGAFMMIYSDDDGYTWSEPGEVVLPRCRYDNDDPAVAKNWWIFQPPIRDAEGRLVMGFTIVVSPSKLDRFRHFPSEISRQAFLYFDNLDDDPEPKDVRVTIEPEDGLAVPHRKDPDISVAQEGAPVLLPDGRLFATMRNMSGHIYYSVREDNGWREPEPLIGWDGNPVNHPLSPCPIYLLEDGTYLCATNNNDDLGRWKRFPDYDYFTENTENPPLPNYYVPRNPLFFMAGVFAPGEKQPIRFGKPLKFADTEFVAVGKRKLSCEGPVYTGITQWRGKTMFWYPDRKYYILGKEITDAFLKELRRGL